MDFPADVPGHKSFARKILEDDINRLVTAIQSLSCGIVLTTQTNAIKRDSPQVEACVFEVDVIDDEDRVGDEEKFCVLRKVFFSRKKYITVYFFTYLSGYVFFLSNDCFLNNLHE